jgi:DNA-binding IclR family transcriptional regulator
MRKAPAQPVNGLIDGLRLLQELATREGAVSGSELAREMGMETTRMNRLLKTLDYLGMADRTPDRRYQAGPGVHVLAAQALSKSKLLQAAAPRLEAIEAPDCIKALGVLWHDKVSYLMHKGPGMGFLESLGRIHAYQATRSSLGMALLAKLEDEELEALYAKREEIPGFKSFKSLRLELEATRKRGYGRLETSPGTISLAVAIGSPAKGAAAVSGKMDAAFERKTIQALSSASEEIAASLKSKED